MKHLLRSAVVAAALALIGPACAQSTGNVSDPALWVVRDADTTVYLFGTVHVLKPGLSWFDEAVRAAFDRSDTLVLEMVQPDPATMQRLVAARGMDANGPPLTGQLPADRRQALADAMAGAGIPAQAYDHMKPWFAAVALSIAPLQKLGYDAGNGPEEVLAGAARTAGKPVVGLETAEQQLGYFDGVSRPAQLRFLLSTLDELPGLGTEMGRMVAEWSEGDPDGLARILNDNLKDSPELASVLLVERNKRWAGWVAERMKRPGTVFVAVGAGHLAGAEAVQAQLARAGVRAERVNY